MLGCCAHDYVFFPRLTQITLTITLMHTLCSTKMSELTNSYWKMVMLLTGTKFFKYKVKFKAYIIHSYFPFLSCTPERYSKAYHGDWRNSSIVKFSLFFQIRVQFLAPILVLGSTQPPVISGIWHHLLASVSVSSCVPVLYYSLSLKRYYINVQYIEVET